MNNAPKVALVTGASSGIGRATAEALSRAGYQVHGTGRSAAPAESGTVRMLTCDVTDQASVEACVAQVLKDAGRIDLLVNNAGIGLFGAAEESSMAQAQQLFEANFFGLLRVTNAVLPTMRRQRAGRIVNVSSVLGLIPAPFAALYAASKHAVEGYSESLDHEVRSLGIRVVLIEPAYTRTSFEASTTPASGTIAAYHDMRARVGAAMRKANEVGTTYQSWPTASSRPPGRNGRAGVTPPGPWRVGSPCCAGSFRRRLSTRACASRVGCERERPIRRRLQMMGTIWSRLAAELKAYGEALAALDEGRAAIDDARLRRIEDELAALKARVAAMRPEPNAPDAERA